MHISSQQHSPNYDPCCAMIESVTVDGVDVTKNCVELNDDEGWVVVLKTKDGKPVIGEDWNFVKEQLFGEVKVTMKKEQ